ncbi:unnamed protein product [Prorocentrum cordatum]|uniref:Methyltransferase FkbM domain-containing protein n=1 Tax=Prorocentrum cordatum TaxID=2364126 RepID=A0ABN9W2R5_9DINO|nr:unnamed protein product [Polarella glacialis]
MTRHRDGNRYYQFTSTQVSQQPSDEDVQRLLLRAETVLRGQRDWRLLTTQWPVWRLLDRLAAAEVVNVTSGGSSFWMHVFPHRVRSDGLISNRIRATARPYCLQLFQDEVLRLASQGGGALRLVEAGPHIGDCMLWASAALGPRVLATAVEPVAQVVSLFRKSILANGFGIDLHHAWLGSAAGPAREGESVPWLSLDSILQEDVDILKIHTNGGETAILDGARRLFADHKVRVVIVHSAEAEELWGSTSFLLERGYSVSTDGRPLLSGDRRWLEERVAERGGLQLHALRRGEAKRRRATSLPPPPSPGLDLGSPRRRVPSRAAQGARDEVLHRSPPGCPGQAPGPSRSGS